MPIFRGFKMYRKGIIEERFLLKNESYIIDLEKVDFITWKENENKRDSYWIKLHVGTKETRYVCEGKDELCHILNTWGLLKETELLLERNEIGENYEF